MMRLKLLYMKITPYGIFLIKYVLIILLYLLIYKILFISYEKYMTNIFIYY